MYDVGSAKLMQDTRYEEVREMRDKRPTTHIENQGGVMSVTKPRAEGKKQTQCGDDDVSHGARTGSRAPP